MSDFNRDDSPIESLTGQPTGQPTNPDSTRRKKLSSDELIALFLAFTGIGSILFWTLGQKTSPINLGALGTGGTPFMSADNSRSSNGNNGSVTGGVTGGVTGAVASPEPQVKPANSQASAAIAPTEEKRKPVVIAPESPEPTPDQSKKAESAKAESSKSAGAAVKSDAKASPESAALVTPPGTGITAKATEPKATEPKAAESPQGTVEQPGKPKTFTDVPDDFWAKPAILALSSRGVIGGFEDGTYKPNQPINRGQFAAMVQKAFEKPRIKDAMTFTDIQSGSPMAPAIEEATRTGFMKGYPNREFRPDQSIPRLEMLSAIATGLNLKPQGDPIQSLIKYNDAEDIPKWAIPKISSAVEAGIVLPNVSQLEPKKVATRADAASYIYQALIKEGKIKP